MLLPPYTIHDRIRLIRLFSGLNQSEMSQRLGLTQGWLSKLESGSGEVTVSHLLALRNHFGINADAMIDGAIPYMDLAMRFGAKARLPTKYTEHANCRMRVIYGLVGLFTKKSGERVVRRALKALGVPPHFLAEPRMPINTRLFIDFMRVCERQGILTNAASWRELAKQSLSPVAMEKDFQRIAEADSPQAALKTFLALLDRYEGDFSHELRPHGRKAAQVTIGAQPGLTRMGRPDWTIGKLWCKYRQELLKKVGDVSGSGSFHVDELQCQYDSTTKDSQCVYELSWA